MLSLMFIGFCSLAIIGIALAKRRSEIRKTNYQNKHYERVYMLRNSRVSIDQVLEEIMNKGI